MTASNNTSAASALSSRPVLELTRCPIVHAMAKQFAVSVLVKTHKEFKDRTNTIPALCGPDGVSSELTRDALRVAKAMDLVTTTGKWGQWVKTSGRLSSFTNKLLNMRLIDSTVTDPDSPMTRAFRQCYVKHNAAVNVGPSTSEGAAWLSLFGTIVKTLQSLSFNGTPCGHASREDGLLDNLIDAANDLLNYDLGGLDGGTCSEALCAVRAAYRAA